jgi:exodeoxyribonuclease VII small subunit
MDRQNSYARTKERLEEIVTQVKAKDMPLEKSLDLYEEALRLGSACAELIDHTDFSVEELEGVSAAGDSATTGNSGDSGDNATAGDSGEFDATGDSGVSDSPDEPAVPAAIDEPAALVATAAIDESETANDMAASGKDR